METANICTLHSYSHLQIIISYNEIATVINR